MTFIDAHQHVWDPACARYDWLTAELAPINRAIDFAELRPALREAGVDATVLVQSADNDDDTDLMLRTAEANPEVAAVVAYVPLARPAATSGFASAVRSMRSVSSSLSADCTSTVASTPASRSAGRSSAKSIARLIGASSAVSQSYRAHAGSHTCWWASMKVMGGHPPSFQAPWSDATGPTMV